MAYPRSTNPTCNSATGQIRRLRRLHDDVLRIEKGLIASKNPGYPLYVVNMPQGLSYVDTFPAEKFFLRFDYMFDMFHLKKLDFAFARLYALHMNYIIGVEQIPHICVADPYFMHEAFLGVCQSTLNTRGITSSVSCSPIRTRRRFSCLIIPCKSSALLSFLRFQ